MNPPVIKDKKPELFPQEAWAICDNTHILERSGTGLLHIYYDKSDAEFAAPGVKAGAPANFDIRIRKIKLS